MSTPRSPLAPDDPRHGTVNGYGNRGCRCDLCREAHRIQHKAYMERVQADKSLTSADHAHGTSYRYDVGCRCDECRAAHNEKSRITKQRIRQRGAKS